VSAVTVMLAGELPVCGQTSAAPASGLLPAADPQSLAEVAAPLMTPLGLSPQTLLTHLTRGHLRVALQLWGGSVQVLGLQQEGLLQWHHNLIL